MKENNLFDPMSAGCFVPGEPSAVFKRELPWEKPFRAQIPGRPSKSARNMEALLLAAHGVEGVLPEGKFLFVHQSPFQESNTNRFYDQVEVARFVPNE